MVKKMHSSGGSNGNGNGAKEAADLSGTIKESASQIWLAGLGAFAKAQQEGTKVFDALVKEGVSIQRKTQSAAEEKLSEATSRMTSMATDISSRASGHWDKLETIFEERVSRALKRLGVPTLRDIEALNARLDALERGSRATPAKTARAARSAGAKAGAAKSPARKHTARKSAS